MSAQPEQAGFPLTPGRDEMPAYYSERIVSMWTAMCTAAKAVPDSWLHSHWSRSIRQLGTLYVAARDVR